MLRRLKAAQAGDKLIAETVATSTTRAEFSPTEEKDLERYIETTRAEMLFAQGVILVEGESELYLVPKIAALHGVELDKLGVTVCSVGGVHFGSYVALLVYLGIPFAVITDGDPGETPSGEDRVDALLRLVIARKKYEATDKGRRLQLAREAGLFVGGATFEIDLLKEGRRKSISRALRHLAPGPAAAARAEAWLENTAPVNPKQVLKDISAIGKGRFAQRLASSLPVRKDNAGNKLTQGPKYILDAIDYITRKLGA